MYRVTCAVGHADAKFARSLSSPKHACSIRVSSSFQNTTSHSPSIGGVSKLLYFVVLAGKCSHYVGSCNVNHGNQHARLVVTSGCWIIVARFRIGASGNPIAAALTAFIHSCTGVVFAGCQRVVIAIGRVHATCYSIASAIAACIKPQAQIIVTVSLGIVVAGCGVHAPQGSAAAAFSACIKFQTCAVVAFCFGVVIAGIWICATLWASITDGPNKFCVIQFICATGGVFDSNKGNIPNATRGVGVLYEAAVVFHHSAIAKIPSKAVVANVGCLVVKDDRQRSITRGRIGVNLQCEVWGDHRNGEGGIGLVNCPPKIGVQDPQGIGGGLDGVYRHQTVTLKSVARGRQHIGGVV